MAVCLGICGQHIDRDLPGMMMIGLNLRKSNELPYSTPLKSKADMDTAEIQVDRCRIIEYTETFYFSYVPILLLLAVMKVTAQVPLLTPWRKVGTMATDRRMKGSWNINGLKICESIDESDS
ncbi:hypothetical protein BZA77DRAFT_347185 [Pyronema omphalodes]|nr:hypothetical protein BZA77DRAFT_347185 [Pyronema omphalodes]